MKAGSAGSREENLNAIMDCTLTANSFYECASLTRHNSLLSGEVMVSVFAVRMSARTQPAIRELPNPYKWM